MKLLSITPANPTIKESEFLSFEDDPITLSDGIENPSMYNNWSLTTIQFTIDTTTVRHEAIFSYSESMRSFKARHTKAVYYNKTESSWVEMKTVIDETNERIIITIPLGVEVVGFIQNNAWYSTFTQQLADEYPIWTAIRTDTKSVGQQFLNFFGLTLEEVQDWIKWVQEQKYVETLDIHQIDFAYIYDIPYNIELENTDNPYTVYDSVGRALGEIYTIREFFNRYKERGYMIDMENRKLFTRRDYGNLKITQFGNEYTLQQKLHHIWNSVDEMALLFGIQRVSGESNKNLRERILDVFRYPAGVHKTGLIYGIARELLLMNRIIWKDDTKDFYIKTNGDYIIPETLHIDHKSIESYGDSIDVTFYQNGDLLIKKMSKLEEHVITFVKNIHMHEFYNKTDEELYDMMFQDNGKASPKLLKWVNEIRQVSPIMWDQTRWDRNYWDTVDKKATGLGYIPNQWDSTLDAWEDD